MDNIGEANVTASVQRVQNFFTERSLHAETRWNADAGNQLSSGSRHRWTPSWRDGSFLHELDLRRNVLPHFQV